MFAALLAWLTAGCSLGAANESALSLPYQPFIAPTLVPTPLPTHTPSPTPLVVETETVQNEPVTSIDASGETCTDNLAFVDDLTIPDGTVVVAGSTLDKQWEVENSGTCNWEEGYQIRLISGEDLGAGSEQALVPARAGSRTTIRIVFTAPDDPGDYRSAWQAFNPQGVAFGDPFFIDFSVE